MIQTIYIHNNLKNLIEDYLLSNNPRIEHGGFFLGNHNQLIIPKLFPNTSNTPERSYKLPSNYNLFLKLDQKFFKMNFSVHFHTHPNHTIPSEADLRYAQAHSDSTFFIVISFNAHDRSFTWRIFNRNGEEQYIELLNQEYETFKKFFANSLNLMNLGNCFITESGELLTGNSLAKAFIQLDEDSLKVYKWYKQHQKNLWRKKKKEIVEEIGISAPKLNKILKRFKKLGIDSIDWK
jgi:proteasome lid subunit RPN8/RPN11